MNGKKAKEFRRTIAVEFKFTGYTDGSVTATGPIDNFLLYRDIMNRGERAILDRIAKALQEKQSNIIVPSVNMPKDVLQNASQKMN